MRPTANPSYARVNVTLPPETLRLIDRVAKKGNRSRFIDEAVRFYAREFGRAKLKRLLREGAIHRAQRDRQVAAEWFALEAETWPPKEN